MPISFDQAWAEAAASAPSDTTFIDTLEITHSSFSQSVKVCNSFQPLNAAGVVYQPFYFELQLPELSQGQLPKLIVKIQNLNQTLRDQLMSTSMATTTALVIYKQYRIVNNIAILGEFMNIPLPVSDISIPSGGENIVITCQPKNIVNLPLHQEFYTLERFPALRT